jgi:hypothetical protein
MTLPAHALRDMQVRLKSVSKQGHFTLDAKIVFRSVSPRIAVAWLKYATWQSLRMSHKQTKLGWSRSVMEGTLLQGPKHVFVLSPSYHSAVTKICHMALLAYSLRSVEFRLKSVSNEVGFTLEAETVFRPYLPSHCCGVTEICHNAILCACATCSAT